MTATAHAKTSQNTNEYDAIGSLRDLLAEDFDAVDTLLSSHLGSHVALIPKLSAHIIAAGGKRLRPLLTIACAKLSGYEGKTHITFASCIELIHTATLLHDDVVDESLVRRGLKTANDVWGNKASVLVGDYLLSRSFQLMVAEKSLPVLELLSDTSAIIAEGEVKQLLLSNNIDATFENYLDVVRCKTAQLFSSTTQIGPILANQDSETISALRDFGTHLGMLFQIVDDLLDYTADDEQTGKTAANDFAQGKITLPVIFALQDATADERTFWKRTLEDLNQNDDDHKTALSILKKHQAFERSIELAQDYANQAHASLSTLPQNVYCKALGEVIDFCMKRTR